MISKKDLTYEQIKIICDKANCFRGSCEVKDRKFGTNPKTDCIILDDMIEKYFGERINA